VLAGCERVGGWVEGYHDEVLMVVRENAVVGEVVAAMLQSVSWVWYCRMRFAIRGAWPCDYGMASVS